MLGDIIIFYVMVAIMVSRQPTTLTTEERMMNMEQMLNLLILHVDETSNELIHRADTIIEENDRWMRERGYR